MIKRAFVVIVTISMLNLNFPVVTLAAGEASRVSKPMHAPQSWVLTETEIQTEKKEDNRGWRSRYKWLVVAGLAIVAAGAVSSGSDDPAEEEGGSGSVNVTW